MTIEATVSHGGLSRERPPAGWEALAASAGYRPRNLARLLGISLRTLQRHFASHYGATVTEWLRSVRMAEAYRQLSAGDTVKSAAYELGFKQASHFSREFKAFHGVPPSCLLQKRLDPARSARTQPNLPEHSPQFMDRTS